MKFIGKNTYIASNYEYTAIMRHMNNVLKNLTTYSAVDFKRRIRKQLCPPSIQLFYVNVIK